MSVNDSGRRTVNALDPVGSLLALLPALALGLTAPWGAGVGVAAAVAAIAAGLLLTLYSRRIGPALPQLPVIAVLGAFTAAAPAGAVTEGLAGLGGLAVVLAVGRNAALPALRGRASRGLVVPALGLGIAMATALIFPPSQRLIGVAALLLLGAVAAVAYLLERPTTAAEEEG